LGLVHGDYTTVSGPRRLQLLAEPPKINDVWRDRLTDSQQALLDPTVVQECLDGQRRFALVNVWRNIDVHHPIAAMPLACVDALTVEPQDLRVLEVHYQDRVGENFLVCPAVTDGENENAASLETPSRDATAPSNGTSGPQQPRHRWVYFPGMVYDECMFIKQWDSAGDYAQSLNRDRTVSTFAIHSAFQDPTTPHDARPRQSIEVRCVAIWDPE
jgi:hypothetical protein